MKKRKVHKYMDTGHLCNSSGFRSGSSCCSPRWRHVTCKICLKMRKK